MRTLDYFLIPDARLLATRLAMFTGLRAAWWLFLTYRFDMAAGALFPNPFSSLWQIVQIRFGYFGLSAMGAAVPWLVDALLATMQLGLLIGLGLVALGKHRPDLAARLPIAAAVHHDGGVDGNRMQRPWWLLPTFMTLSVIVTLYTLAALLLTLGPFGRIPIHTMYGVGAWPVYVGLFLGVLGFLGGHRFNASAQDAIGDAFKVIWLKPDHPIAQRVTNMAARIDLPPPKVGVTNVVNAFAMGPSVKDASVVLGIPLLKHLQPEEVDAVIGHELGHIVSGDMRRMQYAEGFQRTFGTLFYTLGVVLTSVIARQASSASGRQAGSAFGHLFSLLGRAVINLGGELMVKALSRSREFHADAVGAALTSKAAMQSALERLPTIPGDTSPGEDEFAYLMFKPQALRWLFATHPATERRIAALEGETHLRRLPRKVQAAGPQ